MREALARAVNSSDLEQKEYECDVDRLAALGQVTNPLSSHLWRIKFGQDMRAYRAAHALLVKKIKARTRLKAPQVIELLCACALDEWIMDNCRVCRGAGEVIRGGKLMPCPKCEGLGKHRFTDAERARRIGVHVDVFRKTWERKLCLVMEFITGADKTAAATIHTQLEHVSR